MIIISSSSWKRNFPHNAASASASASDSDFNFPYQISFNPREVGVHTYLLAKESWATKENSFRRLGRNKKTEQNTQLALIQPFWIYSRGCKRIVFPDSRDSSPSIPSGDTCSQVSLNFVVFFNRDIKNWLTNASIYCHTKRKKKCFSCSFGIKFHQI